MNTKTKRTQAFATTAAVLACLFVAGCGTETAVPAQDTGVAPAEQVQTDPPGTHKQPPDFMP